MINRTIDLLYNNKDASDSDLISIINCSDTEYLFAKAVKRRKEYYGDKVFIRGLIEISNYCKNDCLYCGIRRSNASLSRYRLTKKDILACAYEGYRLGFRTFVLQGGEDLYFSDDDVCSIVYSLKTAYPDCAVTLSIGEKTRTSYKKYKDAGADRYLLRHETANVSHYARLHPSSMSLDTRKQCLWDLKDLGFQVGSGFMVGSPYQTDSNIVEDLRFLQELCPDMIGIGPFLPHRDTPFKNEPQGSFEKCLNLIAILRLMFPYALIPSTTALATISPNGREQGIMAGANVVMPNLSPSNVRELYSLYNNKAYSGSESAEAIEILKKQMQSIGYRVVTDVGHVAK